MKRVAIFPLALLGIWFSLWLSTPVRAQVTPVEGNLTIPHFTFGSGETLPELKIHYRTLGRPRRDIWGQVRNAVLILHATGSSGAQFITPEFTGTLYGPGQPLDLSKYFLIMPDGVGHGQSSKPSDGLHAHFPHYNYDDMVTAQYRLVTEGLHVNHLRLVMGTSMGGMQTWVWGVKYPDFMDALMPFASLPVQIAGRNRMIRRMAIDSIRNDPEWNYGEYTQQPVRAVTAAIYVSMFMIGSPLQLQKQAPARDQADELFNAQVQAGLAVRDANDTLYQFEASRDYDPSASLEEINAPLIAVNTADDQVNPPELRIAEREIQRVKCGEFVLLPTSDQTRGHASYNYPELWKHHLSALLRKSRHFAGQD
ncbi:MAG TPA: alpha/beta fold hydrolase [Blastocatellia bacterium]|nr:alpha/beta fold hydrolase [Blastocatellia bacterium]